MVSLTSQLLSDPELATDPLCRELVPVLLSPTSRSSSGFPYLHRPAFTRLRDWVPHILASGPGVLEALARIEERASGIGGEDLDSLKEAARVVRQVVNTAAITAPSTLWLLRHVLGVLAGEGICERLMNGEVITPTGCPPLRPEELRIDLNLLLGRAYVVRSGDGVRIGENHTARRVIGEAIPLPEHIPASLTRQWSAAFSGDGLGEEDAAILLEVAADPPGVQQRESGRWSALPEEIEVGYRLVPMVLGLWASGRLPELLEQSIIDERNIIPGNAALGRSALQVLQAAGSLDGTGQWTSVGRRLMTRGVGSFGIIEAYHPYMQELRRVLSEGRGAVHVQRGTNITASQEANRKTFTAANNALDRFCESTGFRFDVFIEHAIGRGEATRQRFERNREGWIHYFGADLEDAAIDAAEAERDAGVLPSEMRFVRKADIGKAAVLVEAIESAGVATEGAVMLVGNGFHEIRGQSDERMVEVFAAYERAGILLLFTEENALSVDDLLETAWNTYHPGFRYVHERSGQGLRPAVPAAPSQMGRSLPASWTECATRAGYVRASEFCDRSRTIYPYPTANGHNPSISHNHFFVPARIAERLGLA